MHLLGWAALLFQSTAIFATTITLGERACPASPIVNASQHAPLWTEKDRKAAVSCLHGRNIWILGNSISRHWAYTLAEILTDGMSGPRKMSRNAKEEQQRHCGSGKQWGDKERPDGGKSFAAKRINGGGCYGICTCHFNRVQSVLGRQSNLIYGWVLDMAAPQIEQWLHNGIPGVSSKPDVVVYNAGMPARACGAATCHFDGNASHAPYLGSLVRRVLDAHPQLRFYWRSSTHLCRPPPGHAVANRTTASINQSLTAEATFANATLGTNLRVKKRHAPTPEPKFQLSSLAEYDLGNAEMHALNSAIEAEVCKDPRVRKLDAFAWTEGACDSYDDNIHHSLLTFSHVVAFLREECGI